MKKILSAAAIALAFVVSAAAQSTPQTTPQPGTSSPEPSQKSSKAHKMGSMSHNVTLTGCLQQGETPDSFELENVQMTQKGTGGSSSSEPATGSTSATGSGTSSGMSAGMSGKDMGEVKLMASPDISLKEHVGHQVEVSGTMTGRGMMKDKSSTTSSDTMGSGSSASSSSAAGTSGTAKDKDTGKEGEHTLRVQSLKHISESCSK
jgi:hypothetical protein